MRRNVILLRMNQPGSLWPAILQGSWTLSRGFRVRIHPGTTRYLAPNQLVGVENAQPDATADAISQIGDGSGPAPAPITTASRPAAAGRARVKPTTGDAGSEATELLGAAPPPRFPAAIKGAGSPAAGKDGLK